MNVRWSEEEDAELRRLTAEGLTAGAIGDAIGRPRNSVIGRWHRLGLDRSEHRRNAGDRLVRSRAAQRGHDHRRAAVARTNQIGAGDSFGATGSAPRASDAEGAAVIIAPHVHGGPAGDAMPIAAESEGSPIVLPARLADRASRSPVGEAILALRHGDCRWPIGDTRGDPAFRFCCARALPGKPYCEEHTTKARGDLRAVQPAPLRMSVESAVVLA